ncbi:MAG: HIRAN domain-containing protein [Clostridia bacterium]|nr:HIRAN domain-containing protein [Clostridia bacterium]
MEDIFITITGLNHYLGMKPFKVGRKVRLVKDKENDFDSEAIRVELPYIDTIGYVANSTHTVYDGTLSAGRVYEKIAEKAVAQVMFITHSGVIAKVLSEDAEKTFGSETL